LFEVESAELQDVALEVHLVMEVPHEDEVVVDHEEGHVAGNLDNNYTATACHMDRACAGMVDMGVDH